MLSPFDSKRYSLGAGTRGYKQRRQHRAFMRSQRAWELVAALEMWRALYKELRRDHGQT